MTPQTIEWVKKAEGDWDVVLLLRRSRKQNRYDAIRFHCQQCAEKYLKARLQEASARFPYTHDLSELLLLVLPLEPSWALLQPELATLTNAAVLFRYPGQWTTARQAKQAFSISQRVRSMARLSLGMKS